LPSLRRQPVIAVLETTFRAACERGRFRLVHYSIQRDHLHLIVEADDHVELGNGMKSIAARIARAVNRVFRRRGACLAGRYHVRWLRSPRQLRNALRYVLLNVRKHYCESHGAPPPVRLDPASLARWFDGWRGRPPDGSSSRPVALARCWLLRVGWRRRGLIDPAEVPG
jgi:REP element-mobilizing transposase RayT